MKLIEVPIIEKALAPTVRAFFSQRGYPTIGDNYSGFNACHYTGDAPAHVNMCREKLCRHFNITIDKLIIPRQTHSAQVAVIKSTPVEPSLLEGVDALVTKLRGTMIAVNTADCLPLLLVDDAAGIIAAIHSGWKGTVNHISANAIDSMLSLGATPSHIKAFIGPSIGACCFEVGDEVVECFKNAFPHNPEIIIEGPRRHHIDLRKAAISTLLDKGLTLENITESGICSRCECDTYFSARKLGINSGRTLTGIMLLP